MKRQSLKILAVLMTLALVLSTAGIAAFAYTGVAGTSTQFNKYLIVDENAAVPEYTFEFSIDTTAGHAADTGTLPVNPGIVVTQTVEGNEVVTAPTVSTAAFNSSSTTYNTVQTGDVITLDSGEKYAKTAVTVNFSGVTFTEPGIYRYVVRETSADQQGITYDTQKSAQATSKVRYLDVYVNDNDGALVVASYVMHDVDDAVPVPAENESSRTLADKSDGFVNEYSSNNLTFGKEVTGNQGSKDKYFDFTLTITNAEPGATYAVDISRAEATSGSNAATIAANSNMANVTSFNTDENGAATVHFYLKDGQYITVKDLPVGASYRVEENEEEYESTTGITATDATDGTAYSDSSEGSISGTDIKTGYTNNKEGIVPTGVILTIAPFAIGLLLFGALMFFLSAKRRREAY